MDAYELIYSKEFSLQSFHYSETNRNYSHKSANQNVSTYLPTIKKEILNIIKYIVI